MLRPRIFSRPERTTGTQAQRLEQHCAQQGWQRCRTLKDLGSGMNYHKPGLRKLLQLLLTGQVQRLVLVTKDRLLRFGAELLFNVCSQLGVEVVVLDAQECISSTEQLTQDLVEILTVFFFSIVWLAQPKESQSHCGHGALKL